MLQQPMPAEWKYAIEAELKGAGLVCQGSPFMPEEKVMPGHLRRQQLFTHIHSK